MCLCIRQLVIKSLSAEAKIRKFCFKMACYTELKLQWICIPALCCIFLDLIISIYLASNFHPTGGYVISNILIHFQFIIISYFSAYLSSRIFDIFRQMANVTLSDSKIFFVFSNTICVPYLILKLLIVFIYIPQFSIPNQFPTLTILQLQIFFGLLSIALFLWAGMIFCIIYWISLVFIGLLMIFIFPGIFCSKDLDYYKISENEYFIIINKMNIDDNGLPNRSSFLYFDFLQKRNVVLDDRDREQCMICLDIMNSYQFVIKLDCGHIFHEKCIELSHQLTPYDQKCYICNDKYSNTLHTDFDLDWNGLKLTYVEYSCITKFHYYMKAIPLIAAYSAGKSNDNLFIQLNIGFNIAIIISLFFVTGFTNFQAIRVLSNSLSTIIVFEQLAYFGHFMDGCIFHYKISLKYFLIDWKQLKSRSQKRQLDIQRILEILICALYITIIFCYLYIDLANMITIEIVFLCTISLKVFLDIVVMFAPLQLLFFLLTLSFDLLFVLPHTLFNMIHMKKSFKQVNLLF